MQALLTTINRFKQFDIEKKKQRKGTFPHTIRASIHITKQIRDMLEALSWQVLDYASYSPNSNPADYHLLVLMRHAPQLSNALIGLLCPQGTTVFLFWRRVQKSSDNEENA